MSKYRISKLHPAHYKQRLVPKALLMYAITTEYLLDTLRPLRHLSACFSPREPTFSLVMFHKGFAVDRVELRWVLFEFFSFLPTTFHTCIHPSPSVTCQTGPDQTVLISGFTCDPLLFSGVIRAFHVR